MDEQKIAKPSFRETVAVTTMDLDDIRLSFNAQRVGPMNFKGLRNADYEKRFRMSTIPEIVPLVYASFENQNYDTAKNVVKALKKYWITGDTGILYVPKGMFVQDNPELKDGRISMNQKVLEKKLGSHEEREVIFSDDRSVRFTSYNFKRESQSALDLSRNTGVIALVGGEENAEKLARTSEHYRLNPYFWVVNKVDRVESPQTRVADLFSDLYNYWLGVDTRNGEDFASRYSFGVLESGA